MPGEWSQWATDNFEGKTDPAQFCEDGSYAVAMKWMEEGGYGLTNLEFWCSNGIFYKMTQEDNGVWNRELGCDEGFDQTIAREQGRYGIVNVCVSCVNSGECDYSNNNFDGNDGYAQSCPGGMKITGFETQEQGGYGIINYRFMCN